MIDANENHTRVKAGSESWKEIFTSSLVAGNTWLSMNQEQEERLSVLLAVKLFKFPFQLWNGPAHVARR